MEQLGPVHNPKGREVKGCDLVIGRIRENHWLAFVTHSRRCCPDHFSPRSWKCRVLKTQELTEKFVPRKEVPAELDIKKIAGDSKVLTGDRKTMEAMELYITSVYRALVFACAPAYEPMNGSWASR